MELPHGKKYRLILFLNRFRTNLCHFSFTDFFDKKKSKKRRLRITWDELFIRNYLDF